jgi:acid phosphatase type 7
MYKSCRMQKAGQFPFFWGLLLFLGINSFSFGWCAEKIYDPIAPYLTWKQDPTTTMTIQWITKPDRKSDIVEYQKGGEFLWHQVTGSHNPLPQGYEGLIHQTELTGLLPNTDYRFRTGSDGKIYKFRTMPSSLTEPIRFVVGGDVYHDSLKFVEETNRQAARTNPHFALIGGDLAYAADKSGILPEDAKRWIDWLATWKEQMVTPDGRLIPLIPAIGNHDVSGRYTQTPAQALFFYALFATHGLQGYNVLDFDGYMSIIILDSGHTHPIEGKQTEWLEQTLKVRRNIPYKFALYHVPAYSSVRDFETKMSPIVRKYWVPLFEEYGLTAAFEHHDHDYKRTYLIKNGKIDPKGVLYLGDGAWGVSHPRLPKTANQAWYLAKTAPARHFILVSLNGKKQTYTAISSDGEAIDRFER